MYSFLTNALYPLTVISSVIRRHKIPLRCKVYFSFSYPCWCWYSFFFLFCGGVLTRVFLTGCVLFFFSAHALYRLTLTLFENVKFLRFYVSFVENFIDFMYNSFTSFEIPKCAGGIVSEWVTLLLDQFRKWLFVWCSVCTYPHYILGSAHFLYWRPRCL